MKAVKFKLKNPSEAYSTLRVDFNINKQRIVLYPGQQANQIETRLWSDKKQEVDKTHLDSNKVNEFLFDWKRKLEDILKQMEKDNKFISKQTVKAKFDVKPAEPEIEVEPEYKLPTDFVLYFDHLNERHKNQWTKDYQAIINQNKKHFMIAMNLVDDNQLKLYNELGSKTKGKFPLKSKPFPFDKINKNTFDIFKSYLYEVQTTVVQDGIKMLDGHTEKYIGKHTKELKRVVREAVKDKLCTKITSDEIKAVKEPDNNVDSIYCNYRDIKGFMDLELEDEEEKIVQEIFTFNCSFGQRYSDILRLNRVKFTEEDGDIIFLTRQKKTGLPVKFVLDVNAARILRKHDFEIPQISSVKFNKIIKKVAYMVPSMHQKVEITEKRGGKEKTNFIEKHKLISSHTMRRSFCTNYFKNKVNIQTIMAISGHSSEESFKVYLKESFDLDEMKVEICKVPDLTKMTFAD